MMKVFKTSLRPDRLVQRSLSVSWTSPSAKNEALRELNVQPFVQEAVFDDATGFLSVEYDTSHKDIRDLETLIQSLGGNLPHGWRQRLAYLWHLIQDRNRGMSEKLDSDQQVHCHTLHQKPAKRHSGWRSWPGD